jgi:peptidoglycan hydrolase FlgJ
MKINLAEKGGMPNSKIENDSKTAKVEKRLKEAESAAQQFETVFVNMMLKAMKETAKPEEESNALGIYNDMLGDEHSKSMASSHSFGIKQAVLDWIKQNDPELSSENVTGNLKQAIKSYQQNRL